MIKKRTYNFIVLCLLLFYLTACHSKTDTVTIVKNSETVINNGKKMNENSQNNVLKESHKKIINNVNNNEIVIVNGKKISENSQNKELKEFDEKILDDVKNIEKISIESESIDINVLTSNSSNVESHLHGSAFVDGNIELNTEVVGEELIITVTSEGSYTIEDSYLQLDVAIPKKMNVIKVNGISSNIELAENVETERMLLKTVSGQIYSSATSSDIVADTTSGDINLYLSAKQDIGVDVSAVSGDVCISLNNIENANVYSNSMSGDVINHLREEKGGYEANLNIGTVSGDIILE